MGTAAQCGEAWGRAGKAGKGRTHAHQCQNVSGKLVLVRVGPAKKSSAQDVLVLQQVCRAIRAQTAQT